MNKQPSRRDFLKLAGVALSSLSLSSLAFRSAGAQTYNTPFPYEDEQGQGSLARVTVKQIDLRTRPNDEAAIVGNRFRDQLVQIYDEVVPADAPKYFNNLWYKVWGGYLHSAYLQLVKINLNDPVYQVSEAGQLAEVTVPYTEAYQYNEREGWFPWRGSRLYYETVHWVTGVQNGPDGAPWYQITSELSKAEKYFAPAKHLRLIPADEIAPLSPDIPAEKKRIEVSLSEQTLRAFENDNLVLETKVSTGIPNNLLPSSELSTATPKGRFRIYAKQPSKHMGSITGNPDALANGGFSLPGVPWTNFFKSPGGYAFHGTYWHNNFGLQMSHGCVNMRNEDAKWLFRWTTPTYDASKIERPADWEQRGNGTSVHVY